MFDRITPIVKQLLIINIGIYLLSFALPWVFNYGAFYQPIIPTSDGSMLNPNFKLWQFITYMFLHSKSSLGHIFGNMFGLFIFGSSLESYMGSKKFLIYYLITGIGASLLNSGLGFYELSKMVEDTQYIVSQAMIPMVGASGAIFGILVAFGVLFPNVELMLLFFPIPIKAKYFVILYGLYELYAGTAGLQQGVAHFAHIGGLITGLILLKFFGFDERQGHNFRKW